MTEAPRHITDTSFEQEVLASDLPVLVDYWAEWCGPCKAIGPVIDRLAGEYSGRLKVAKLDTDANVETPRRYGVRSIPTLMLFRNGRPVATKVGAVGRAELVDFVEAHLA